MHRRTALKTFAASAAGYSLSGWLPQLAAAANAAKTDRACILLWMTGGPSQLDTFDPKPGHENGGEFKAIDTAVPGIRIGEHLPGLAQRMNHLRADPVDEHQGGGPRPRHLPGPHRLHARRTGAVPGTGVAAQQGTARPDGADLPGYVSVAPFQFANPAAFGPGFLGPAYAPLVVGDGPGFGPGQSGDAAALTVKNLAPPSGVDAERMEARLGLLAAMEQEFAAGRPDGVLAGRRTAYEKADADDVHRRRRGVRSGRRAGPAPRPVRPQPVRAGLPAGPAAGGAGRAVRGGLPERGRRLAGVRLGHAPGQLHRRQDAVRRARPGVEHPAGRPVRPAACSTPPPSSGWASSAAPRRSTPTPAATTSRSRGVRCSPAAASAADRWWGPPPTTAWRSPTARSACRT